jgi:hypothetical protein
MQMKISRRTFVAAGMATATPQASGADDLAKYTTAEGGRITMRKA